MADIGNSPVLQVYHWDTEPDQELRVFVNFPQHALQDFCGLDLTSQILETVINPQGEHTRKLVLIGSTLEAYEYIFDWMSECNRLGRPISAPLIHDNALCRYWHILQASEDLEIELLRLAIDAYITDIIGAQAAVDDIRKVYKTQPVEYDLKAMLVQSIVEANFEDRLRGAHLYNKLGEEIPEFHDDMVYELNRRTPIVSTYTIRDTVGTVLATIVESQEEDMLDKNADGVALENTRMDEVDDSPGHTAIQIWRQEFWAKAVVSQRNS